MVFYQFREILDACLDYAGLWRAFRSVATDLPFQSPEQQFICLICNLKRQIMSIHPAVFSSEFMFYWSPHQSQTVGRPLYVSSCNSWWWSSLSQATKCAGGENPGGLQLWHLPLFPSPDRAWYVEPEIQNDWFRLFNLHSINDIWLLQTWCFGVLIRNSIERKESISHAIVNVCINSYVFLPLAFLISYHSMLNSRASWPWKF